VGNIILLALAAAVYPTLLAGVIVLLARDEPAGLLAAFLAGGMLISITAGLFIVFALDGTVSRSNQKSASPTVDLVAGILSIILAVVLWKRERDRRGPRNEAPTKIKDGPSWTQRTLGKGSAWAAFAAGLILNLPGIWYLDALKDIAKANKGTATTIVWILVFVVIMFALAELPLIGYAVDPDGTRVRVQRFQH
jgi:Sap, sulfolipid-1-addressing protein